MANELIVIGGSAAGGGGGLPAAPGVPIPLSFQAIDTTPDASGNPQKLVTGVYAPPSPLGTFNGIDVYLDAPDTAGGLHIADGTIPADGTQPAIGVFSPQFVKFVPYQVGNLQFTFIWPAPTVNQFWRGYITGAAANTKVPPVQAGTPGATPSLQFVVLPPAHLITTIGTTVGTTTSGVEYAPLIQNMVLTDGSITGWATNPVYEVSASGDQYFQVTASWDWPASDPLFPKLGGVNFILQDNTNGLQQYLFDVVVTSTGIFTSTRITIPQGTSNYTLYAFSFDVNGNSNSIVPGVTPAVNFQVTQGIGPVGVEYCPLVQSDGTHAFVTATPFVATSDGTRVIQVTGWWLALQPGDTLFDPRLGAVQLVVDKNDGNGPIWLVAKGAGAAAPIQNNLPMPSTVITYTFYLQSVDINGRKNTIVPGTTPSVAISVGSATPTLNLAQALPASISSQFSLLSGAQTITNLNANAITTGILKVGNTTGAITEFDVYDHVGSLIGWIGDDTANSGFVGGWLKQVYFGGSGPGSAVASVNSSGLFTLTSNANGVTTTLNQQNIGGAIGVLGINVKTNGGGTQDISVASGGFYIRGTDQSTYVVQLAAGGNDGQLQLQNLAGTHFATLAVGGAGSPFLVMSNGGSSGKYWYDHISFNGTQVVTSQQSGPGNPSFVVLSDAEFWCQSLLNALRAHGLVT